MDELIKRYQQIHLAEQQELAAITAEINALELKRQEMSQPFQKAKEELMVDISDEIHSLGKSYKCQYGTVKFRKGYTRYSWNTKGLNGFAVAHPEVLTFRKETEVKPSISIQVVEEEQ